VDTTSGQILIKKGVELHLLHRIEMINLAVKWFGTRLEFNCMIPGMVRW
jgi:hypothetical protein